MWGPLILIALYVAVANAALILIAACRVPGDYSVVFEIGRGAGLTAFGIIMLQPVLAARLKTCERPFGLDIISRFHKIMGVFVAALLLLHPTLMAQGGMGWSLLTKLDLEWYFWVGRVVLVLVFGHALLSVFRRPLGVRFELWRRVHYVLGAVIVAAVFVHSWWGGYDMGPLSIQMLWIALVTMSFAAYTYHKVLMPIALRRRPYTVAEVRKETHNVWDIKLAPPSGEKIHEYYPGQFHFVTLYRGGDLPVEEHHWTISSSPTQQGFLSSTIKESGDFTKTIGLTKPGDRALVQGPFGRFSYVLHPGHKDFVFIAAGIGITPFMAMLRHMRDTGVDVNVTLFCVNRTDKDIAFREELEAMAASQRPHLTVVHVLSRPTPDWNGETGHLDQETIRRFSSGSPSESAFFVCSPPAMTAGVIRLLRAEGVPYHHIHTEQFSL
jgi:predicted ferric reductase